ncbi:MAG: hypothetical protein ABEH38_00235 [Flavobacteriales bacterium]
MKPRIILLFLTLTSLVGFTACVVMAEPVRGKKDLAYLKGQEVLAVEFLYLDPKVTHTEKESEYLPEKVEELNSEKSGRGDLYKTEWHQNKGELYEPAFIEAMDKELAEDPLKVRHRSNVDKKYEVKAVVKVNRLDPGVQPSRPMKVETRMLLKDRKSGEVLTELEYDASSFDSTLLAKSFHLRLKKGFKASGKRYGLYFENEGTGLEDGS